MKSNFLKVFFTAAALIIFTLAAQAQTSSTATGHVGVTARLSDQVKIVKVADLDFGGIFIPMGDVPCEVTMAYTGVASVTSGTTSLYLREVQHVGQLNIYSGSSNAFSIEYPATLDLELEGSVGSETITYTPQLYKNDASGTPINSSATADKYTDEHPGYDDHLQVLVAGKLTVTDDAMPGKYTGQLDVTITWE